MHRRAATAVVAAAVCLSLATAVPAQAGSSTPLPGAVPSAAPSNPSAATASSSPDPTTEATTDPTTASPSSTPDPSPTSTSSARAASVSLPRRIALSVPASTVVMRSVTVSGTVEGDQATAVTLWRSSGTGWSKVSTGTVADTGEWSLSWIADVPGTVQLRASTAYVDGTTSTSPASTLLVAALVDAASSGPLLRTDVPSSYRNGCPVPPSALRQLSVNYWDYTGRVRRGVLVVSASALPVVRRAFTRAFTDRFQIKQIRPVDVYYGPGVTPTGSDVRAMNAGNTSAYNCRGVTGSRFRVSQHSYGTAVDINTFENPYVTSSRVFPAKARGKYVRNRARHLGDPGVLRRSSIVTRVFLQEGWNWGGFWAHRDWQHFSVKGR